MTLASRVAARWRAANVPEYRYVDVPPTPAQARCRHPKAYRNRAGDECAICGSKKIDGRWRYLDERAFHYYTSGKSANVVQFKGRPRGPQALIGGRKYALSNYWPMMGQEGDEGDQPGQPLPGARLIDVGGSKYRYLWVYDTERQTLAMWRYSDGDEKVYERAHSVAQHIHRLDKLGQLNRATNAEFRVVEREMGRRSKDSIKALQEYARSLGGDWQKQVNQIARNLFDRKYRPRIERGLREVEKGVVPLSFRFNERIPKSREAQLRTHVVTQVTGQFTEQAVEDEMRVRGLDPEAEGVDNQAAHWAVNEIREDVYDEYLR